MANLYVRSTDGSNADAGSTWALAKATLAGAAAIDAAGDVIYISQAHSENSAASQSIPFAGSLALPTRVICGNDAAEPPTAVSTAAIVAVSGGAFSITITGLSFYAYGISFQANTGASAGFVTVGASYGHYVEFDKCQFILGGSSGSSRIDLGGERGKVLWKNCDVKFGAVGQQITNHQNKFFYWSGGALLSGGTSPTTLFSAFSGTTSHVLIDGVDFSAAGASMNLFTAGEQGRAVVRNCKLPASWSGSLVTGSVSYEQRFELHNCDSGDTNYRLQVTSYAGTISSETTVVRTGGASDGTTPLAWKVVSTANAEYPHITLDTPEIVRWNETTGSAITATVEIVTDNVTLKESECWLEVQYLGTSGFPLGVYGSDGESNVLTGLAGSSANQTSSSETWTTTGLGTPVKQKLSVTFTPQEKGFIHAVVKVAKASTTVYVDPLLTIT